MSSFFKKFTGRKGTKQQVTQNLPAAPAQASTPTAQVTVPSYEHADKQKGPVDQDKEENSATDQAVETEAGRNPAAESGPSSKLKAPQKQVERNVQNTQAGTSSTVTTTISHFAKYWAGSTGYDLEPVVYFENNEWTPNSLGLFEALRAATPFVINNRYLLKHHPEYLDYATICYYSILFYIQILRAREAAQFITGEESTFLRRFRRSFPEEKLVVSEVVAPILSSIVAVQLEDAQFDWICPRIATELYSPLMSNTGFLDSGSQFLQPLVPYMLSVLRLAIHKDMKAHMFDSLPAHNTEMIYFNDSDQFVPRAFTENAGARRLWGQNFTKGTAADRNSLLASAGLSHPFEADMDNLLLAIPIWNRSRFAELRVLPADPVSTRNGAMPDRFVKDGSTPIRNLEEFMFMPKDKNMSWFETLLQNAVTHARFFSSQVNLSDIPVVGGNESLILAEFKREGTRYQSTAADYTDIQAGIAADDLAWYPQPFDRCRAGFYTHIASPAREEILQAMTFGVNGTLPVSIANTNGDQRRVGQVNAQRSGPFFDQTGAKQSYAMHYDDDAVAHVLGAAKPMFDNFSSMIQEKMRLVKPKGM